MNKINQDQYHQLTDDEAYMPSRREFLFSGALVLAGMALGACSRVENNSQPIIIKGEIGANPTRQLEPTALLKGFDGQEAVNLSTSIQGSTLQGGLDLSRKVIERYRYLRGRQDDIGAVRLDNKTTQFAVPATIAGRSGNAKAFFDTQTDGNPDMKGLVKAEVDLGGSLITIERTLYDTNGEVTADPITAATEGWQLTSSNEDAIKGWPSDPANTATNLDELRAIQATTNSGLDFLASKVKFK